MYNKKRLKTDKVVKEETQPVILELKFCKYCKYYKQPLCLCEEAKFVAKKGTCKHWEKR